MMPDWPAVAAAGLVVGLLFGLFGVGGSSFATPALGLLGVPGLIAVASPLPATIPAALAGMVGYARRGEVQWDVARWTIYGGVPATVAGALLSRWVGGDGLLVASGVVLMLVGIRVLVPLRESSADGRARRRIGVVVPAAAAVGLFTGLLANGGGFLLVPLFVVILAMTITEAAGTSLVVIVALSIPTLLTHLALGNIDWAIGGAFALGAIPGSAAGSVAAGRIPAEALKKVFGALLIAFAAYFIFRQISSD